MSPQQDDSMRLYRDAKEAAGRDELDEAVEFAERSLAAWPHPKTAELLGELLLRRGEAARAAVFLGAAAGLGNKAFRARYFLAKALLVLGDEVGAFEQLQQAVNLQPSYRRARELLESVSRSSRVRAAVRREED